MLWSSEQPPSPLVCPRGLYTPPIDYIDCHTLFYDEPVGHELEVRKTTSLSPDPRLLDIPEVCLGKQTKIDAILVLDTRGGFMLSFCDKCTKDFKNNVGKP